MNSAAQLSITIAIWTGLMITTSANATISKSKFGVMPDGAPVDLFTLTNSHGMQAKITTLGAMVTSLKVPDKSGKVVDVVLGFDSLDTYVKGHPVLGSTIGRVANRIAKGKFTLDDKTYKLAINNGPNCLHGGLIGFDKRIWTAKIVMSGSGHAVQLSYTSPDGEEGFPGSMKAVVTFQLTESNALRIDYKATTNKTTLCNLTNHSYFNLAGTGDVLDHELTIYANNFVPVDDTMIPTGKLQAVKGTPMDFLHSRKIGERIDQVGKDPIGYDHCYVLNSGGKSFARGVRVVEPISGRVMEMWSDVPGVQLYTANFMDGTMTGRTGEVFNRHYAFCLEAGSFPDAINHPNFPSIILRPGQTYTQHTEYRFSNLK